MKNLIKQQLDDNTIVVEDKYASYLCCLFFKELKPSNPCLTLEMLMEDTVEEAVDVIGISTMKAIIRKFKVFYEDGYEYLFYHSDSQNRGFHLKIEDVKNYLGLI